MTDTNPWQFAADAFRAYVDAMGRKGLIPTPTGPVRAALPFLGVAAVFALFTLGILIGPLGLRPGVRLPPYRRRR